MFSWRGVSAGARLLVVVSFVVAPNALGWPAAAEAVPAVAAQATIPFAGVLHVDSQGLMVGERAYLDGRVPGGRRPYVLQVTTGHRWRTVKHGWTDRSGRFGFFGPRAQSRPLIARIVARSHDGRRAIQTHWNAITGLRQGARVMSPRTQTVWTGDLIPITVAFSPVVVGRAVSLESFNHATAQWEVVNQGTEGPTGVVTLVAPAIAPKPGGTGALFRMVAAAYRGASAKVSNDVYVEAFDPPPPPVTDLTAVATSPTTVDLSWKNPTDSPAFAGVYLSRVLGPVPANDPDHRVDPVLPADAESYHDTGLAPGATYSYTVFDYNGDTSPHYSRATITITMPTS